MADSAVHNHWQRAGATLHEEHQNTAHLRPPGVNAAAFGPSDIRHLGRPTAMPETGFRDPNAAQLNRRSSVRYTANLSRGGSSRLSPAARWRRFLKRFNWNQRSKVYAFGKAYLQRQPSFIVTPDRSSYAYSFKNRDLTKRKPRPRAWKTSQPLNVWKNPNPMDVLANGGQVELPDFLRSGGQVGPSVGLEGGLSAPGAPEATFSAAPGGAEKPVGRPSADLGAAANAVDTDEQRKHLVKISLPVKHNRTSSTSKEENMQHSTSTSTPGTTNTTRSSSSWLDAIPQTPVATAQRRRKDAGSTSGGAEGAGPTPEKLTSRALQDSTEPTTPVPSSARKATRNEGLATPIGLAAQGGAPQATTRETSPPHTPTSLPSNYRPESWRRSAIIARNASDPLAEETLYVDADSGFTGTWSAYLRRAVAQRVVEGRQRKSWELRNEIRWSQNLEWDSDSSSGSSRGRDDDDASFDTSTGSTSGSSFPSELSEYSYAEGSPASSNAGSRYNLREQSDEDVDPSRANKSVSSLNTAADSSSERLPTPPEKVKAQAMIRSQDSEEPTSPRAQAITGESVSVQPLQMASPKRHSLSRLAPLNSPRDMASASAIALAKAKSSPASVAASKTSLVAPGTAPGSAPGTVPSTESVMPAPVTLDPLIAATSSSPRRSEGGGRLQGSSLLVGNDMQTPWQEESHHESNSTSSGASVASAGRSSASSSSSHLDERETYIFPPQGNLGFTMATMITEDSSPSNTPVHMRSLSGAEFDFSDRGSARKRQLPESPLNTPPRSPEPEKTGIVASDCGDSTDPLGTHKPASSIGSDKTGSSSANTVIDHIEGAPAIVRSQSQWKKTQSGPKRVKSSSSRDFLVHTRQKTMESLWGGEDDDESDNAAS